MTSLGLLFALMCSSIQLLYGFLFVLVCIFAFVFCVLVLHCALDVLWIVRDINCGLCCLFVVFSGFFGWLFVVCLFLFRCLFWFACLTVCCL